MEESWDWVEEELKKMQTELPVDPEMMQVVDAISVADFWKRRYDEEMMLWEKKLTIKEDEKKSLQDKASTHEMAIKELDWKLKELERRWDQEKLMLEDRIKAKEVEAQLEAAKRQWESKTKAVEEENKYLKTKIGAEQGVQFAPPAAGVPAGLDYAREQMAKQLKSLEDSLKKNEEEGRQRLEKLESEKKEVAQILAEKEKQFAQEKESWQKLEKEVSHMSSQMTMRLTNLKEREQDHFTILEDLARGFAHRVRNYLGIISGTVQLGLVNFKMEPELEEQLKVVDQNVQDMLKSIEDFLSLARVPEMSIKPANLNQTLDNSCRSMDGKIRENKVEVTKNFASDLPLFPCDEHLFGNAFNYLLENSIEAMPQGGRLTLTTAYDKSKDLITIKIADSGSGISENHMKKVFQPYFTSKKNRKGLGLTAAMRVVDLHRGTLTLESAKDKGTTITINLIVDSAKNGNA
jgi:signal transduction histidine kinase